MGPGSAGVAAVQSFYPIQPAYEQLPGIIAATSSKPALIYVVWSRHDYDFGPDRNAEIASGELLGWLRDANVDATGRGRSNLIIY